MIKIPLYLLPHRATIKRTTLTDAGAGQWQRGLTTIATARPCRIWRARASEQELGRARDVVVTHGAAFLPDEDVRRGDVLTVDGVDLAVIEIGLPSVPHHKEALLESVELGAVS